MHSRTVAIAVLSLVYCADAARVAVLVERGLPAYGGTPSIAPGKMVDVLRRNGVDAVAVPATEAADGERLNVEAFPVLVMPYGNAFPRPALANLRAFHAAGGCLVLNGVPFCHPCDKEDGEWKDLGHVNRFGHDPKGMGTGGFTDVKEGPLCVEHHGFRENLLGLGDGFPLPSGRKMQCLDVKALSPQDEAIPLIGIVPTGGKQSFPASALIRHGCGEFRGAVDVWIGQVASKMEEPDRFLFEQLLVRGVVRCLFEKGELSEAQLRSHFARLDKVGLPEPLPGGLPFVDVPRPWGDTFLPKSKPPARRLLVAEVAKCTPEERIAITCLQGLLSRKQPRLWQVRIPEDRWWLDWHKQKGHVDGYDVVDDWTTLFAEFADAHNGAVLADPALYRGELLAANVAACEDLIVATPELAKRLGLPVKVDLRGRFETYVDGMRWVWDTYKDRLNHHLCDYMHPARLGRCAFAYDMQWRAIVFWIAGSVDEAEPGADRFAERRLMAEIMSETAPNTAVLGFPYAGTGVGPGEPAGVALASRYAKGLVCTDNLCNRVVTSGIRIGQLAQPAQPPPPKLERDKVYIALAVSDGDNQNCWLRFFKGYFEHEAFGTFPLAFGIGPPIRELMPAVAQWYYEHATATTEFIADVSGVAYIQPENYALAYADRDRVFDGFLDWTGRLMRSMDIRTVRTVGGGDELVAGYAQALPSCHSIFADMGRYSGRTGIKALTFSLDDGTPVFRAVTSWRHGKDGFLREIREQVGTQRPAFVNGFVHCWTFRMDDLARIYRERDADMVFVTPAQLAALYRRARE